MITLVWMIDLSLSLATPHSVPRSDSVTWTSFSKQYFEGSFEDPFFDSGEDSTDSFQSDGGKGGGSMSSPVLSYDGEKSPEASSTSERLLNAFVFTTEFSDLCMVRF